MSRKANLEFANLICKFGHEINLLDLANEVILPAVTNPARVRRYGETRYFFHDPQLVRVGTVRDPVLLIAARFVKDTKLRRAQYFDEARGLVRDERVLDSAPSALFVLILNSHKLLFFPETAHAPTLGNLEMTFRRFIADGYSEFVEARYRDLVAAHSSEGGRAARPTKIAIRREFPPPNVQLIPIGGEAELRGFVDKFETLQASEISLVETNSEIDNNDFIRQLRDSGEDANASMTTLTHRNPKGLSKDGVYEQLAAAATDGNSRIKLVGKDSAGGDLRGSNDEFRVRTPIGDVSGTLREASRELYAKYSENVEAGTIPASEIAAAVKAKVRAVYEEHRAEADA